jgi:hypothetical protein
MRWNDLPHMDWTMVLAIVLLAIALTLGSNWLWPPQWGGC